MINVDGMVVLNTKNDKFRSFFSFKFSSAVENEKSEFKHLFWA